MKSYENGKMSKMEGKSILCCFFNLSMFIEFTSADLDNVFPPTKAAGVVEWMNRIGQR